MDVSVVLACHNSNVVNLKRTINSVLSQTLKNIELIIVDDGSTIPLNDSFLVSYDDRVKIVRLDKAKGLGAALNYGISYASGKYIARIDDDDLMSNTRLELQYNYLEKNFDVVCLGTRLFFRIGDKILKYRKFPLNTSEILKDLVNLKFSLAHTTVMFRRDSFDEIGGYRILGGGQDLDLFLQFSTVGELANLEEYLNYYTLSSNGLSVRSPKAKYKAYIFALEEFLKSEKSIGLEKDIQNTIYSLNRESFIRLYRLKVVRLILRMYVMICGRNVLLNGK